MVHKMSSTEEYLDQLLAAAIQKNMEMQGLVEKKAEVPSERKEDLAEREEELSDEELLEEELSDEELLEEELSDEEMFAEDRSADRSLVNQPWSDMEDMSVETLLSMTEGELEENEDPNHMMTPDEIAALLGAQEDGESAEAEETEPEVNEDPNH
ncbi:MAG: hypothetical protein K2K20_02775, partial [Lachnospiraceae bacterium]|nr:hypothetical protein [Lachnospiraceae bacterium]